MNMSTATADIPMGWGNPPYAAPTHSFANLDTQPRLIRGAGAAPELAQLAGVWRSELHPADNIVEPKLDGIRALYLGGTGRHLVSREGSPLGCAAHCLDALLDLEAAYGKPMMFDAEFMAPGGLTETLRAFRRNRPVAGGTLWLFDAVPLDRWEAAAHTAPLAARRATLLAMGARVQRAQVGMVTGYPLDADATMTLARHFWKRGFEGLVVKDATQGYQRGRNNGWLKLKQGE